MLGKPIAGGTGAADQAYGRRVARKVRRVARLVAGPAFLLMLGGLLAYGAESGQLLQRRASGLPGPQSVPLSQLTAASQLISAEGAMSLGLMAFALVPTITVLTILVDHLRDKRWGEAAVAAAVIGIMALSAVLGKK
jgi:hypothetical protein